MHSSCACLRATIGFLFFTCFMCRKCVTLIHLSLVHVKINVPYTCKYNYYVNIFNKFSTSVSSRKFNNFDKCSAWKLIICWGRNHGMLVPPTYGNLSTTYRQNLTKMYQANRFSLTWLITNHWDRNHFAYYIDIIIVCGYSQKMSNL